MAQREVHSARMTTTFGATGVFPQILPHRRPIGKSGTIAWSSCSALSTAGVPQQMHEQDHFRGKSSKFLRPSMSPEGMVQRHLLDRELLKVRALFSVGMPTLFLGAAPKDACAVASGMLLFTGQLSR